jgi:hypothetical protein
LTPEYLSRALRELEEGGLIEGDGGRIRVTGVKRLADFQTPGN